VGVGLILTPYILETVQVCIVNKNNFIRNTMKKTSWKLGEK